MQENTIEKREDCPCKRKGCVRHGDCTACKKHHIGAKHPVYCMREPKKGK